MQRLLILAAVGEAAIGLALLAYPPVVVRLLFGAEIIGAGIVMSRIAGIALIAFGIACWSGRATAALSGMLACSLLATLYLAYLGLGGEWTGKLLWLAVALHSVLTVLLARTWLKDWQAPGTPIHDQTGT